MYSRTIALSIVLLCSPASADQLQIAGKTYEYHGFEDRVWEWRCSYRSEITSTVTFDTTGDFGEGSLYWGRDMPSQINSPEPCELDPGDTSGSVRTIWQFSTYVGSLKILETDIENKTVVGSANWSILGDGKYLQITFREYNIQYTRLFRRQD